MAAPKWFETTTYFNNKLAQMQRDEPEGNWTADSLTAAFEASGYNVNSADSMYTHFEQYGNTVNERVSPNQYFDNDYYMNSKLAQMQTTNPGYTMDQLMTAMFAEGNMSPWTHYTLYGFAEGIDPSAGFNTNDYMAAKLAQMQATDPSYTMDRLFEAFRAGNLNPIEHYFEYGVNENLDFTPGGDVTPPAEYNEIPLVAGEHEFTGTAGNDNFIASVASSSSQSTLQKDDVIDGVEGQDILTVDLASNWGAFSSKGGMSDVETVNINNSGSRAHTFNATGIEGAQTYNIDGNVSLSNVAAGVAVNLADVNAATSIGFADGAVDGVNDTLALGLENVIVAATSKSSAQPVDIKIQGIENLDVTASGLENRVDLSGVTEMKALSINGEGKLYVTDVDSKLETINAADTSGNLVIDATRTTRDIKSAELGSGNDTLTVKNLSRAAVINGGEGDDELVIAGVGKSTYQLQMDGVEGVTVDGNADDVVLDGVNTSGLEALTVKNAGADVTLAGYTGSSELTINVLGGGDGKNASKVFVDEIQSVNFNVGDDSNGTRDEFSGELILPDASQLNIQVLEGTAAGEATFKGKIDADQVTDLSIDTASNNSIFELKSGSALSNVESVTVTGFGDVDLGSEVGGAADNLTVDASRLLADFSGDFRGGEGQTLDVTGSRTGANEITVNGAYDSIAVTGGMGRDELILDAAAAAAGVSADLGDGTNVVRVKGNVTGADFSDISGVTQFVFDSGSNWQNATFADDFSPEEGVSVFVSSGSSTSIPAGTANYVVNPPQGVTSVDVNGSGSPLSSINVGNSDAIVSFNNITPAGDTFSITAGSDANFNTPAFGDLKILSLNSTSEDATLNVDMTGTAMDDMKTLYVSGAGDVILNGLLGKTGWTDIGPAVEVNGTDLLAGSSFNGARFNSDKLTYNGGAGDESFQVYLNNTDNEINLGAGSDYALIQTGTHSVAGGAKFATAAVDLGNDASQDVLSMMSPGGWSPHMPQCGTMLTVDNFVTGTDILNIETVSADDGTPYKLGSFMNFQNISGNEANVALLLNNFDLGLTAASIKGGGNEVIYADRNGTTNAYVVYLDGAVHLDGTKFDGSVTLTTFNGSPAALDGVTLIELVGVKNTALTSVADLSGTLPDA